MSTADLLKAELTNLVQIEIEKLSKTLTQEIERRVNELNTDRIAEESKNEDEDVDEEVNVETEETPDESFETSFKTSKEAFIASGGDDAMNRYKEMSQNLRKEIVSEVIQVQIEKMLPPSIEWNGASKLLVNQPYVRSIDDLYKKADSAFEIFKRAIEEIAAKTSSTPRVPGLKGRKRAEEKAKFKYSDEDGNGVAYYRLTDIVRATLVFDSIADMYKGLDFIKNGIKSGGPFDKIIEFNDRFETPVPKSGGYRDLQLALRLKDGFVCELQMSTKPMIQVKEMFGHRDYEVFRRLKAAVKDRNIEQIEAALAFGQEQLGSQCAAKEKFLPERCYPLVLDAAKAGDADILDRLIECGADATYQDEENNTPLHYAVSHGHERCVWLLLDKYDCRTDLRNKAQETALMSGYIAFYSQPSEQARRAISTLLQKSDEQRVKETARDFKNFVKKRLSPSMELVDCAAVGNCDRMRELLRAYAAPDSDREGKSALHEAYTNGKASAVELLLEFDATLSRTLFLHPPPKNEYRIAKAIAGNNFAKSNCLLFPPESIPCEVEGKSLYKWSGIAVCGSKLFCAPHNASSILVIDGETEETHTIPCEVENNVKWSGIAVCGSKLFCAPCCASSILVIDGETEETHTIPCGVEGNFKWSGIAVCGSKLFCAPRNASSILVIDGETEETHTIPCGVKGYQDEKWSGIAVCGNKLFCAPHDASSILVVDPRNDIPSLVQSWRQSCPTRVHNSQALLDCAVTGEIEEMKGLLCALADPNSSNKGTSTIEVAAGAGNKKFIEFLLEWGTKPTLNSIIQALSAQHVEIAKFLFELQHWETDVLLAPVMSPCEVEGDKNQKWSGIAVCGNKLFCAPSHASSILVIDGETEETHTIPCGVEGNSRKWSGIAVCGSKLFCAPYNASSILVIDGETEKTHAIPCGVEGGSKWSGIAVCGNKLFCAPFEASSILVIDGETEETHTIPCEVGGYWKWSGIAVCGSKLFCAPCCASSILVIDGETEETHTIPCGGGGNYKWSGIAVCGDKLFCAPCCASSILVIDGETEETHTNPYGVEGNYKWSGIAVCGNKLFCAPSYASSFLVVKDHLPFLQGDPVLHKSLKID